jgi:hypothetical protein
VLRFCQGRDWQAAGCKQFIGRERGVRCDATAWKVDKTHDASRAIWDCHPALTVIKFFIAEMLQHAIMSDEPKEPLSANDLLKNSSLYREFQAEREEILKHKWIESEKAGRDIGFERALTDWIIKHRSKWRKSRQTAIH